MSRSNPNENTNPNPAVRWFEWNGEQGVIRYYDKETKKNVDVGSDFLFLLLDQVGRVGGWHDASDSGIYSNEVKDTRQERLVVKAFKGGTIAEGIYRDIKDRVNAAGGHYVANCYIAFNNGATGMEIGCLRIKGAALRTWMDFTKEHKKELYAKAIRINGYTEGRKGKVTFRVPILSLKDITPERHAMALELDKELQRYFASYFKKPTSARVDDPVGDDMPPPQDEPEGPPPLTDDDIPW